MKRKPEETMKMLERNKTMSEENKKSPAKKVRPLVKITSPKGYGFKWTTEYAVHVTFGTKQDIMDAIFEDAKGLKFKDIPKLLKEMMPCTILEETKEIPFAEAQKLYFQGGKDSAGSDILTF